MKLVQTEEANEAALFVRKTAQGSGHQNEPRQEKVVIQNFKLRQKDKMRTESFLIVSCDTESCRTWIDSYPRLDFQWKWYSHTAHETVVHTEHEGAYVLWLYSLRAGTINCRNNKLNSYQSLKLLKLLTSLRVGEGRDRMYSQSFLSHNTDNIIMLQIMCRYTDNNIGVSQEHTCDK